VIDDMRLHDAACGSSSGPISNFLPLDERRYLKLGGGLERTQKEFSKFSAARCERLPAYYEALDGIGDLLRELSLQTPPDMGALLRSGTRGLRQARTFGALTLEQRRDLPRISSRSLRPTS
jgi:phytoene dehydrogenase-like protein